MIIIYFINQITIHKNQLIKNSILNVKMLQNFTLLNNYQKVTFIAQNIQLIISISGIMGNSVAFTVFLRKPLRSQSYACYFRLMCFADSIILAHSFRHWFRIVLGVDTDLMSPLFCRLGEFQPFTASTIAIWLRLVILFDRLIHISYPNYFWMVKDKRFQLIAISIIIGYSVLLNLTLPLNYSLQVDKNSNKNSTTQICHLPAEIRELHLELFSSDVAITIVIATILDLKLISNIYSSSKQEKNELYRPHSSIVKDRKFAISSIGISLANFVCLFTFGILILASVKFNLNVDQMQTLFTCVITVTLCSNASTFFISLFMNSVFYREFRELIGLK